jgi:hypothetical protein
MKLRNVLAIGLLCAATSAFAGAPSIHINGFGCGMIDGDGNPFIADISSVVITSSGNANLKCQTKGTVPNSTGKAVVYNFENTGITCETTSGVTAKWKETVSASGNATLTCHMEP